MMGVYLTSLRNRKEDAPPAACPTKTMRARSCSCSRSACYELNDDGTEHGGNAPTETYTHDDIAGPGQGLHRLQLVAGPNWPDRLHQRPLRGESDPDRDFRPMQAYNQYHSTSEKRFLGTVIPAQATADAEGDLRTALDTLFNHRNVGPFIGKQLIQRMVTSNPSPAYVGAVAAAFNNNGSACAAT